MLLPSGAYELFLNVNFIVHILVIQLISAYCCSLCLLLFPPFPPHSSLFISMPDFDGTEPSALHSACFADLSQGAPSLCLQFRAGDPTSGKKGDGQADTQLMVSLGQRGDKSWGEMSSGRCQICSQLGALLTPLLLEGCFVPLLLSGLAFFHFLNIVILSSLGGSVACAACTTALKLAAIHLDQVDLCFNA